MKKFRIILMVPTAYDLEVADAQIAHNEATRLAKGKTFDGIEARVHIIQELGDVPTHTKDMEYD